MFKFYRDTQMTKLEGVIDFDLLTCEVITDYDNLEFKYETL